jgi:hypothetical protein
MTKLYKPISKKALEQLLGQKQMQAFSLAYFGGVMLTADVSSGRKRVDIMFREEPDLKLPFSGWVFLSSQESSTLAKDLDLHDPLAILRLAPEVANYLNLPPGTSLIRTGDKTFVEDKGTKRSVK